MNEMTRAFVHNFMEKVETSVEGLGALALLTDDPKERILIAGQLQGVSIVLEHVSAEIDKMEANPNYG